MINQSQLLKGTVVSPGYFKPSKGYAWTALRAVETSAEYGAPEGSILVLKDGDNKDISEQSIQRLGGVVIEQHDSRSHVADLCRKNRVPCIVGVTGITNQVRRREYLEINPRAGTVQNFNPGFFGRVSNYIRRQQPVSQQTEKDNIFSEESQTREPKKDSQLFEKRPKNDLFGQSVNSEEKTFGVDLDRNKLN